METQANIKCPKCGSENVVIVKRGYSLLGGIVWGILFVFLYFMYTVINDGATFSSLSEAGQAGYATGMFLIMIPLFLLGLFFGLIGKNELVATCLKCGKKFDPKKGLVE